jgi:hypothetical protein
LPEKQTRREEAVERRLEFNFRLVHHRSQQRMRELAANRRPDLCYLFSRTAEPIKPRHQRCVQARRNSQCWRRNGGGGPLRFALALGLQHSLCHFLHEQRDAVGAFNDVLSDTLWQRFVACYAIYHRSDFALAEAIKGESGDVGPTNPRRLEFRSIGDNQQHPACSQPINRAPNRFQARWVNPMHVLENHQHRLGLRQRLQLRGKRLQRLLPPLLWV